MIRDKERNTKLFYKLRCRGFFRKSSHLGAYKNGGENRANILSFDSAMNIKIRGKIYASGILRIIKMEPR
jgi:hypothetical protein